MSISSTLLPNCGLLSGAESSWHCFSVSFGGLPRAVLVFGDEFGDECERSVRRLFGSHVTRYHMDISRVCKRLIIVSLRVCSGPQQTRYVAWIIALAEISSSCGGQLGISGILV